MGEVILQALAIYGLAIVISFLVAALIRGIVVALPMLRREAPPAPPKPVAAPVGVPAEHVAAIAAAIAAVIGPSHILHIEAQPGGTGWAAEGRAVHQRSHAINRTGRR